MFRNKINAIVDLITTQKREAVNFLPEGFFFHFKAMHMKSDHSCERGSSFLATEEATS